MSSTRTIRWGRIALAILLGELIPILVLVAIVAMYPLFSRSGSAQTPEAFAQAAGPFVGPIAGALMGFCLGWWAGRDSSAALLQAILIGLGIAAVDLGILVAAGERMRLLFILSNVGKLAAASLGGLAVSRSSRNSGTAAAAG